MKYRIKGNIEGILDASQLEAVTDELQPGDKVEVKAGAKCEYPSKWDGSKVDLDNVQLSEQGEQQAFMGVVTAIGKVNAVVNIPWAETSNIYAIADLEKA